jgi:hypothetical protein
MAQRGAAKVSGRGGFGLMVMLVTSSTRAVVD